MMGDWVHEDEILGAAKIPLRSNCAAVFDKSQVEALEEWWQEHGCPDSVMRFHDFEIERAMTVPER
jgi:hypothetical protein